MDISFLTDYINPIILGICLIVGFVIKQAFTKFENRYIPLAATCLGALLSVLLNIGELSEAVVLGGMISGLASTGLYEMLRNLLKYDCKSDDETDDGK